MKDVSCMIPHLISNPSLDTYIISDLKRQLECLLSSHVTEMRRAIQDVYHSLIWRNDLGVGEDKARGAFPTLMKVPTG